MHRLSSIVFILLGFIQVYAQTPHGESFKIDCAACHNPSGWTVDKDNITFEHDKTNFKLDGQHNSVDCKSCHSSLIFEDANFQCVSCHNDVHSMSVGNDCSRCHSTNNWLVDNIPEIHEESGFALIGSHADVSCVACHSSETNLRFDNIGNDCASCHMNDFKAAKNPDHDGGGFSTNCIECHNPIKDGWNSDNFNHDMFPLTLGHDIMDCKRCHLTGNYSDASPLCISCHLQTFNSTANPNHVTENISTTCSDCHSIASWSPSTFIHDVFPIKGAHLAIAFSCNECHHGSYTNTPNTCDGCHLTDYNNTNNPSHSTAQLPTDCILCHDETAWIPSSFNHNMYPIIGAHTAIANDCNLCHNGNYTNTPNTCAGCHLPDYNVAANPDHSSNQLPTDCIQCHDENAWIPSSFDHSLFPIIGAHSPIVNDCNLCHNGNYTNTPNTCDACHMPDYNSTANPNHSSAQFPTDCILCHDETAWSPSSFTHNSFPLLGAHANITNCNQCHNGNFTNTPNTCDACHMTDYNATTNPNHSSAQFPTDCILCHDETAWVPSSFTHSLYPLVGAHANITNCNQCHNGNFTNTPNTCDACHITDYNTANNPNHSSAQYPTDCTLCHDETAWAPSNFDHDADYFPIYSGKHDGEWNTCTDCHLNTSNYALFSCIDCHQHDNQSQVNNDHSQVSGYSYNSVACLNCHPQGD